MNKTAPKVCLVGITKDHVSNLIDNSQSGMQDLNLRPLLPKSSALPS